jgi:cell division protein FtsQ
MTAAPPRRRPAPSVPGADRLAVRARAERSARRGRWARRTGSALLVGLPLLAVAWVLLLSTWLAVDEVRVTGLERLTVAQVRAAVDLPSDTPLARVDTGAVERAVGRLAPADQVEVRRSWPGTLVVEVTERTPVLGVVRDDGVLLLDARGTGFATERALPPGVVRLQVNAPGPDDPATRAALAVHAELPEPLRSRVRIVRAASPSAVELLTDTGKKVVWGAPGGAGTKAAAVMALLRMPGDVFDVSAPGVATRR